jgi:hypothetical protein
MLYPSAYLMTVSLVPSPSLGVSALFKRMHIGLIFLPVVRHLIPTLSSFETLK